ncbi:peptidoglycan-binding domain-containing protein [Streptomyces sp. NPDC050263]|uniref:peptidoglycan-binding domain-containing protein n=1 Tax=Streptomyces sp. NPDC050263 TaxID=3155037 RepID=UPI003440BC20
MAHDDQFTAVGPSLTGAGFPRAGFSTKSTDTVYGVNAVGTFCGVYGESLAPGEESDREAERDLIGVVGEGSTYGVLGRGRTLAGVVGFGRRGDTGGVFGISMSRAPGVVGQSRIDFRFALPTGDNAEHGGSAIGVLGESGSGTGVSGESSQGAGVSGASTSGRGGEFSSSQAAQIRLAPSGGTTAPPDTGQAGDLLAIQQDAFATLWFCVLPQIDGRPAVWGKVHLDRPSFPSPTLDEGAEGQDVKNAQGLLAAHGHDPGPIDGVFGPQTAAATRGFQEEAGIVVDGQIGPQTWNALLNHF